MEQGYDMHGEDQSILDIFGLSAHRKCTDDRDRVYAMLGLFRERLPVVPDYSKSADLVLLDFATKSLISGDLSLLHACEFNDERKHHGASFVPAVDTAFGPYITATLDAGADLRAGLRYPAQVEMLNLRSVRITGVSIDVVVEVVDSTWATGLLASAEHVTRRHWKYIVQSYALCIRWLQRFGRDHDPMEVGIGAFDTFGDFLTDRASQNDSLPPPYRAFATDGNRKERTPRVSGFDQDSDRIKESAEVSRESSSATKSFLDLFLSTTSLQDITLPLLSTSASDGYWDALTTIIISKLASRKLFMTSSGYLGMGPYSLREGDQIVIFDGAMTPFVLREQRCSDGEIIPETWEFVGDCYLHGWMNGDYFGYQVVDSDEDAQAQADGNGTHTGERQHRTLERRHFTLV